MILKKQIIFFALAFLAAPVLFSCTQTAEKKAVEKPNIIFILADDLGYGDLGCYGQTRIQTPHLDRMAREGVRFTQFYAGSPVCAPSRSALLTGRHTGHTYIRGNKEIQPEGQEPLADSIFTMAEVMQDAGYITGAFGKWGLGFVGSEGDPNNQGFDEFYGYNCQRQAHRYYPTHLWHNDQKIVLEGNGLEETTVYAPDKIQAEALKFIEKNREKPFFLFLPYNLPHAELIVPADSLFDLYKSRFEEEPHKGDDYGPGASIGGYTSQEYPRATYAAMISRLDMYVGQVLNKLKEAGIDENTLVIFASDNGPSAEGGADPEFFNSNGPLRGYKRDLYEGGIRSPFIARWPEKIDDGTESTQITAMWHLLPTFAELAGAEVPADIDGVSFATALLGKTGEAETPEYLYWEFYEQGGKKAVRKGNWKAVKLNIKKNPASPPELYNLADDPGEQHNVASEHPEIIKEMEAIMREAHVGSPLFTF